MVPVSTPLYCVSLTLTRKSLQLLHGDDTPVMVCDAVAVALNMMAPSSLFGVVKLTIKSPAVGASLHEPVSTARLTPSTAIQREVTAPPSLPRPRLERPGAPAAPARSGCDLPTQGNPPRPGCCRCCRPGRGSGWRRSTH